MSELIASQTPHLTLRVHTLDNVRVALTDLPAGTVIEDQEGVNVTLPGPVRHKHKFVLSDMAVGEMVIMYGVRVGKVTQAIAAGEAITTENLVHSTEDLSANTHQDAWQPRSNRVRDNNIRWLSPPRWASGNSQCVVGGALGILREP